MDLRIDKKILDNIEIIIKYQNIRLVTDICNYMKWNETIKQKIIKILIEI